MVIGSPSNRRKIIKEGISEHQGGRENRRKAEIWVHTTDCTFLEFYESYLMIETKIKILPNTQENDV